MRPTDFAAQLNVSLANGWGIVRTVTDLCMKMPEGKYVLVKDPNRVRFCILQYIFSISSLTCFQISP
jgi:translation initiation factor 3 subunit D